MFFGYYGATQTIKIEWSQLFQKYALYFARVIIMAGLLGLMNFFGMDMIYGGLGLLALNTVFRIAAMLTAYTDGKIIFQLGFYLSVAFLLVFAWVSEGWVAMFEVLSLLRVFHLGLIAFFTFILGLYKPIERYIRYKLAVLTLWTIFLLVFEYIQNMYIALAINSMILTGLYYLIYTVFQLPPEDEMVRKDISVRRILAGERITEVKRHFRSPLMSKLHEFVGSMPSATKNILECFNILLILILIVYYVSHVGEFLSVSHFFYRVSIIAFVVNVVLLKRVQYKSIIQNLVLFLVINFAIYISLFSYFQGHAGSMATRGIIWNVVSALMIFYAHKVPMLEALFEKRDYVYWIVACIAAMVVNVILLLYTTLPGELIFFVVLVYVGLQSMIIYYASKYLARIPSIE